MLSRIQSRFNVFPRIFQRIVIQLQFLCKFFCQDAANTEDITVFYGLLNGGLGTFRILEIVVVGVYMKKIAKRSNVILNFIDREKCYWTIDHTDFLGDTIEKIAMEKSGIIKKNCPVVLYSQAELVYNIIKDAAARMDAPFYCLNDAEIRVASQTLEGTVFSVKNKCFSLENLELSLLGTYQLENCLAVLEACLVLNKNGLSIPEGAIRNGLKNARWAGRMELCGKAPLVILDGAHNADGIRQLANSLSVYFKEKKVTLILGILGDKEYRRMAEQILPFAETVILTEPHSERRLDVFSLARSVSDFSGTVEMEKEIEAAYERARTLTPQDGIILCCGSLYMIGAMRTYLKHRKNS